VELAFICISLKFETINLDKFCHDRDMETCAISLNYIYINDLPKILEDKSLPILFADDTSIVISRDNTEQLIGAMNEILSILDCWFKKNLMSLNLTKTNYIDFIVNNQVSKRIGNTDSNISRTMYTKFLGFTFNMI
jgi:hypothetical protein